MQITLKTILNVGTDVVSILELIIALLALLTSYELSDTIVFPDDMHVVRYQMVLNATGVFCLICGISNWLANTSIARTRMHVQIFIMFVLWTAFVSIDLSDDFDGAYRKDYLFGYFEKEIYDEEDYVILFASAAMGWTIMVLIIVVNVILSVWCVAQYADMQLHNSKYS